MVLKIMEGVHIMLISSSDFIVRRRCWLIQKRRNQFFVHALVAERYRILSRALFFFLLFVHVYCCRGGYCQDRQQISAYFCDVRKRTLHLVAAGLRALRCDIVLAKPVFCRKLFCIIVYERTNFEGRGEGAGQLVYT